MAAPIFEAPIQAPPPEPEMEPDETVVLASHPVETHARSEPEPEPVLGDTPLSAIERLAAPSDRYSRTRRRDRLLTAAWAASFAALTAIGVAGYTERDTLMKQWPASKRVYATLGLVSLDMKPDPAKDAAAKGPSR
jgi:hypothetical protein